MSSQYLCLFVIFYSVLSVFCLAPPYLSKCNNADEKCAKTVAIGALPHLVAGLPEYGIESLDPKFFPMLNASTQNLRLEFTDVTMKGLKDCRPNEIVRNRDDTKMSIRITCDIDFSGQYEMHGKLLFVPIEGKGKAHIRLRKIEMKNVLNLNTIVDANGVKHWNIAGYKHSYKLKDTARVSLANLFGGNEALAAIAKNLIANNGNAVVEETGPPIIALVVAESVNNINKLFHQVPLEDFVTGH